jgi:hypothetical protein
VHAPFLAAILAAGERHRAAGGQRRRACEHEWRRHRDRSTDPQTALVQVQGERRQRIGAARPLGTLRQQLLPQPGERRGIARQIGGRQRGVQGQRVLRREVAQQQRGSREAAGAAPQRAAAATADQNRSSSPATPTPA